MTPGMVAGPRTTVGTPSTKPDSPTVDSITAGSRSITVEWSEPESDGGSDISSYDLRYIKTSELIADLHSYYLPAR